MQRAVAPDDMIPVVEKLIACGADVNRVSTSGDTPLSEARKGGNETIIRLLLDEGAKEWSPGS